MTPKTKTHRITIRRATTKWRAANYIRALALVVVPIGIGIVAESAAMQWMGFFLAILMLLGLAHRDASKDLGLSIDEARKRLDEIEAEEREGR